jgi:hypothetical protein
MASTFTKFRNPSGDWVAHTQHAIFSQFQGSQDSIYLGYTSESIDSISVDNLCSALGIDNGRGMMEVQQGFILVNRLDANGSTRDIEAFCLLLQS